MKLKAIPCSSCDVPPLQRMQMCLAINMYVDIEYARELEKCLCNACTAIPYRVKCVELLHMLYSNSKELCLYHSPNEVADLLLNGLLHPNLDERYTKMYETKIQHKSILVEGIKQIEQMIQIKGLLQCQRCKSDDIITEQKQTRSADEGMCVFAQCRKCFTKWKM